MNERKQRHGGLTPKQRVFVREYLVDLNATQAAIRAGFSPKTARIQASGLLAKPNIREVLAKAHRRHAEKAEIKAEDVLAELKRLAFSDLGEAFDATGALKAIRDMPDDTRRAISGAEVVMRSCGDGEAPEVVRKIKLWDKLKALELLAKHLGLCREQVEHSGGVHVTWGFDPSGGEQADEVQGAAQDDGSRSRADMACGPGNAAGPELPGSCGDSPSGASSWSSEGVRPNWVEDGVPEPVKGDAE